MPYRHRLVKDAKAKAASNPEVKKVKPSIQPIVVSNRVYLHFKGDPYTAAWIGYGKFQDAGSGDKTYVVCAPSVENNRYDTHRHQHYMRMSINLKKAVGFTSTFTRPYKALTIAEINLRDVGNAAGMSHGELSNKVDEMRATLFGRSYSSSATPVMAEIKHLVASGYSFMDKKLEAEAHEFFELQRKQQASATLNKNLAATAVICTGTTLKGEQKFETVRCSDMGSYNREVLHETHQYYIGTDKIPDGIECVDTDLSPIYNSVSDLPDWVQGRLAVIAMLQVGELVAGVGGRISDNQYWIVPDTY